MDTAGTDERALPWVHILADEVGARRPTSAAERRAAERVREELRVTGLSAQLEEFRGYATFAAPYALIIGLALAPVLLPRSRHLLRSLLAASATAALVTEGGLRHTPVSNVLSRRRSQNLVATIEPQGRRERTLCLVCHLDSSRSGLMFHPSVVGKLNAALNLFALAGVFQGAELFLARFRLGRRMLALSRLLLAAAGALLLERELLGQDVPGANDNASGVAVVSELARELVTAPLEFTRVVVLMTGCEESGLLGSQAFLRSRDTSSWLFVNFDNVGGPATLRYAKREGVAQKWDADTLLVAIAERTAAAHRCRQAGPGSRAQRGTDRTHL
jgi:hypothetical protein